jgi:hypothetical protein
MSEPKRLTPGDDPVPISDVLKEIFEKLDSPVVPAQKIVGEPDDRKDFDPDIDDGIPF